MFIFAITLVSTLIAGWTALNLKAEANTESIANLFVEVANNKREFVTGNIQLSAQLSQIQTDLQWIKAKIK